MTIDEKTLQNLIGFTDEVGVLSFYAGFTPDQAADPQPRTPIEIRNLIRDVKRRLRDEEPHDRWQAVEQRLDALDDGVLGGLLDPKAHGRGRAMFVAVSDGRTEQVSLQLPFESRVVFDETPFIRPLVAAHDEGRAAGILIVHAKGARLLRWVVGECEELDGWDFEVGDAQLADIKSGPSANNPRMEQEGLVNRERFEDRIDENRHRFLRAVLDDVGHRTQAEGWDRMVISGAAKIRDEVHGAFQVDSGTRVLLAEPSWEDLSPHEVASRVWPILRSVHHERELELVKLSIDRALSGNAGALGPKKVVAALNEGRVAHLLFQSRMELVGFTTEEGTLHTEVGGTAAQAGFEMRRELLFVERMVEKAIAMGGHVTPIDDDQAAAHLEEHDGVAALLRW